MAPDVTTMNSQSANGGIMTLSNRVSNALMSILTITCIGCFSFLWSISKDIAILKDHDSNRSANVDRLQNDVNSLRNEVQNANNNIILLKQMVDEINQNQKQK